MKLHAYNENNRFAWLTPIQNTKTSKGPWILSENETHRYAISPGDTNRKVTVGGLLTLIASVSGIDSITTKSADNNGWQSDCGRFTVSWEKQKSDSSRLFVQKREDFYARIELHINGDLALAFQEPVWPHLQHKSPNEPGRLDIPAECLLALEKGAAACKNTCSNDSTMPTARSADRAA